MNRKLVMLLAAVGLLLALFALGDTLGGTPKAFADPSSVNWDVILCDKIGGANDPACNDINASAGDSDGIIETGEHPEIRHVFKMDIVPGAASEEFIGLANVAWSGITPLWAPPSPMATGWGKGRTTSRPTSSPP